MAKKRKVNKSQKVRDYLAEHPDAGPTETARALKRFKVSVALVSSIKGKNQPARRRTKSAGRRRANTVEPVIAAAELIRACGGVEEAKDALSTAAKVAAALR